MPTNIYYTKKFNSGRDLADFLNFTETSPIEEGTGYVDTEALIATSQTVYSDWRDIDGNGTDLAGVLVLSGAVNADIYRTLGAATAADRIAVSGHTNQGSSNSPVNYRVYAAAPTFTGTISNISVGSEGVILTWYKQAKLHF